MKKNSSEAKNDYIKNSFNCPIIFKNFDEEVIPENKVILYEIKSGYSIDEVLSQLNVRIKIIRDCLFVEEEKPLYFIGLINLLSKNVDKVKKNVENNIQVEENLLLVVSVDYEYCGIDASKEIHNYYLLHKKIDNVEKKMEAKFDALEKKISNNSNILTSLSYKIDLMFQNMLLFHPGSTINLTLSVNKP